MDKCNAALEETVKMEEAEPLFDQAANKFQEVAALALFNWGNVHMCCARRLEAKAGMPQEGASKEEAAKNFHPPVEQIMAQYAKAEEQYKKSLEIKADFYEVPLAV